MYEIEKKDTLPDFVGKIVYLNFSSYNAKSFVTLIVEQSDSLEIVKQKFEVFDTKLVEQFTNNLFKVQDYIGLSFKEIQAINSKTNEPFVKRRVYDTFKVRPILNLSNYTWKKYAKQNAKSDKIK